MVDEVKLLRARKLADKDQRAAAKRDRKARARLQRKCFWTWPLGHRYDHFTEDDENGDPVKRHACVACGKPF